MFQGSVVSIHIASGPGEATASVAKAQAVAGKGLEGDRYYMETGTFSNPQPDRELTLIEIEAIEALKHEGGAILAEGESRRNIVTRGVPLNHLVGLEFKIGAVRIRGLKLCEPCSHLARLTSQGVLPGLVHRGGLRAQILNDGVISVGDEISE